MENTYDVKLGEPVTIFKKEIFKSGTTIFIMYLSHPLKHTLEKMIQK